MHAVIATGELRKHQRPLPERLRAEICDALKMDESRAAPFLAKLDELAALYSWSASLRRRDKYKETLGRIQKQASALYETLESIEPIKIWNVQGLPTLDLTVVQLLGGHGGPPTKDIQLLHFLLGEIRDSSSRALKAVFGRRGKPASNAPRWIVERVAEYFRDELKLKPTCYREGKFVQVVSALLPHLDPELYQDSDSATETAYKTALKVLPH